MIFRQKCVFYVTLVVIKYKIKSYLVAEYVKSQIGICAIISSKLNDNCVSFILISIFGSVVAN